MKKIITCIFLSLIFILSAKNLDVTFHENEKVDVENVLPEENVIGYQYSSVAKFPNSGDVYIDSESLARQYRVFGRGQRPFSVQYVHINKGSIYRLANRRLERLFHSINHIYTSMPRQSRVIPSLYYVFELRHILI